MTVAELIERLAALPPHLEVIALSASMSDFEVDQVRLVDEIRQYPFGGDEYHAHYVEIS